MLQADKSVVKYGMYGEAGWEGGDRRQKILAEVGIE
jgi:hypothetical protein